MPKVTPREKKIPIKVYITKAEFERLDQEAVKRSLSVSALVRDLLHLDTE